MPKIVHFGEFFENLKLAVKSVTRQVSFLIGQKLVQNAKIKMRHFGWFSNNMLLREELLLKLKHFLLCLLVIDGISVSLSDNCSKARKKPLTLLMKNALNYTHRALLYYTLKEGSYILFANRKTYFFWSYEA